MPTRRRSACFEEVEHGASDRACPSPSHGFAAGPSLSPRRRGEGWGEGTAPRFKFTRTHTKSVRNTGFSLIETLVALAIVGMAMAAIAGTFGSGLLGHQVSEDAATALSLAEAQIAAAGITEPLAPQQREGVVADRFRWRVTVAPYDEPHKAGPLSPSQPKGLFRLYRIAVAVDWREGWRQREIGLDTLRLGPPPP